MNYQEFLAHFNPNHDSETGRFTTKSGTYLKAGTRLNSVTTRYVDSNQYKNSGKWLYTYRDDEEWDNKVYKGPFAVYLARRDRGAKFIAEHKYMTVKDLKLPTREQRIQEFKNLKSRHLIEDLAKVRKSLVDYGVGNEEERKQYKQFNPKHIKTEKDWEVAYSIFSHAMESSWYYKSTKEYCEKMSKKYDAMVDDNNKGVYNRAVDPIIIFRANEALKVVGDVPVANLLRSNEIVKNYKDVGDELRKHGERVKI